MTFKPSKYQEAVFNALCKDDGNIVVEAVAGGGKTSTILEGLNKLIKAGVHPALILFVAFNKNIAKELSARVPDGVEARTFGSLGHRALYKYCKKLNLDKRKGWNIASNLTDEPQPITQLLDLARQDGIGCLKPDESYYWLELIDHHGIQTKDPDVTVKTAQAALAISNKQAREGLIDFTDQLYLPVLWNLEFYPKSFVFVDEAQDVNRIQRELLRRMIGHEGRLIAVGDSKQCHPAGTMIETTRKGKIPIEKLCVGDELVSYHDCFRGIKSQGRRVQAIQKRHEGREVRRIRTKSGEVTVTNNHRMLVKLPKTSGYALYVMEQGYTSRLGVCKFTYSCGLGIPARMRHEKASKAWLLNVFDRKEDALVAETELGLLYRIPTNIFREKGRLKDRLLDAIGDNSGFVKNLLRSYGLCYEYPLFTKESRSSHAYSFMTAACNVRNGWLVRTFNGTKNGGSWEPVAVERQPFQGHVYSLKVEPTEGGRRLYVANNIVVGNSIYGFRGASVDALDLIEGLFDAKRLPLSICYRCDAAIVEEAKKVVPQIEPRPDAEPGQLIWSNSFSAQTFCDGEAILCRNNKPLVELAYKLIGHGVGCSIRGRDIGKGLYSLVEKMKARTTETLIERLEEYRRRNVERLIEEGQEDQAQSLQDQVDTLLVIVSRVPIDSLKQEIDDMFKDTVDGKLLLSSIHKAKGLEWDSVYLLDPDLLPSRFAKKEWQIQQEHNLYYVAVTRARKRLCFINSDDWGIAQ